MDILAENAAEAARERSEPPVSCPNDGTPLDSVNGVLHCPFDGYVYPPGAQPV